jgi:hypothetical protein
LLLLLLFSLLLWLDCAKTQLGAHTRARHKQQRPTERLKRAIFAEHADSLRRAHRRRVQRLKLKLNDNLLSGTDQTATTVPLLNATCLVVVLQTDLQENGVIGALWRAVLLRQLRSGPPCCLFSAEEVLNASR